MDLLGLAAVSLAVGFGVGILSGLLGIGGGTILVPTFKLGYAMDPIACTATSLFTIIPTSLSGAVSHIRNKTCIPKLGVLAGLGGAVTSPIGVWLATRSADWMIMAAAAVIIAYSSFTMLQKALRMPAARLRAEGAARRDAAAGTAPAVGDAANGDRPDPASPEPPAVAPTFAPTGRDLALGAAIGALAGIASGYVGVGGGFLMVPLMLQLLRAPMKLVSGTSLIAVMILAVPGVIYQAVLGNIDWVAGVFVACGSIPGAAIGARLVSRVPERTLRFIFSALLFVAAVSLVVNQTGLLG